MGLIDMASWQSRWKGLDYYKDGNVLSHKRHNEKFINGKVSGSNNNVYDVSIDIEHPVNSVCNCPYAVDTKRRVCKHMVALFCTTLENPDKYFDDMVNDYNRKVDEHNEKVENSTYNNPANIRWSPRRKRRKSYRLHRQIN